MSALPLQREPFLQLVRSTPANASPARRPWTMPATFSTVDDVQVMADRIERCGAYCDTAILSALSDLESLLPVLAGELGESSLFWQALCERISTIEDMAGSDGWMHVNREVDLMLERLGIDPGGWNGYFDA